jgi:hypothetical protein
MRPNLEWDRRTDMRNRVKRGAAQVARHIRREDRRDFQMLYCRNNKELYRPTRPNPHSIMVRAELRASFDGPDTSWRGREVPFAAGAVRPFPVAGGASPQQNLLRPVVSGEDHQGVVDDSVRRVDRVLRRSRYRVRAGCLPSRTAWFDP